MPLREAEVTASLCVAGQKSILLSTQLTGSFTRRFRVGSHLDFTATHDGELVCFANDADWLYWNNEGQLRVDVTRGVEINNQCVGDDVAALTPSSGERTVSTLSSRRRLDGAEVDATMQRERAVKF